MANFAPGKIGQLIESHKSGDSNKARSIYFDFLVPFRHMDLQAVTQGIPIQIAQTKETMNLLGMAGGTVRPPLLPLTSEQRERLKTILADLNILPKVTTSFH